jgi:peptide/nickel transport system substrate-binding protein
MDRDRARKLLAAAGLTDRNGDGALRRRGRQAGAVLDTHAGGSRARARRIGAQEQLRQLGVAVDIVPLDPKGLQQRWIAGDFDAIYFGLQTSSTDPDPDFWLSSGPFHFWNPGQASPATPWEKRIDELMREETTAPDLKQRQRAFAEVQQIFAEELPSLYFVVSRVAPAPSLRVINRIRAARAAPVARIPWLSLVRPLPHSPRIAPGRSTKNFVVHRGLLTYLLRRLLLAALLVFVVSSAP